MNWYYVVNGQQVGPINETDFEAAIRAGTVTPTTLVWREGMAEWQPLQALQPGSAAPGAACAGCGRWFAPEELVQLGGATVCASCKPAFVQRLREGAPLVTAQQGTATEAEILGREYRIDIGECLSQAWTAFTENKQLFIVGALLAGVILLAASLVSGLLPIVGNLIYFVIYAPLLAGFQWYLLRICRHEELGVSEIFAGFRRGLGQLLLNALVQGLLTLACILPIIILAVVGVFMTVGMRFFQEGPQTSGSMIGFFGLVIVLVVLLGAVMAYLTTIWSFTQLLIIDKGYQFWPAMQLSRKLVQRRWWMTFGFLVVSGLIMSLGFLACGVGILISAPVGYAMQALLFEANFRDLQPRG